MLRRSIAQRAARPDLAQEEEDDTYDSGTGVSYADSGGQDRSTLPEELPLTEDQIASLWEQARSIVESDHPNEVETQDEIIAWLNVGVMGWGVSCGGTLIMSSKWIPSQLLWRGSFISVGKRNRRR